MTPAGPRAPATPADLLAAWLRADAAKPLLTYYDGPSGARIELSGTTFANWVAKTANLLGDELAVEPGGRIGIALPAHWLGPVWLLAAWSCGATVCLDLGADLDVVAAGPDELAGALASGAAAVVAVSTTPLGRGFPGPLPAGVLDYGAEVLGHGDRLAADRLDPTAPALRTAAEVLAAGQLVDAAVAAAERLRLGHTSRVLTDRNLAAAGGVVDALLAPLAARAPVVLAVDVDAAALGRIRETERITHDLTS